MAGKKNSTASRTTKNSKLSRAKTSSNSKKSTSGKTSTRKTSTNSRGKNTNRTTSTRNKSQNKTNISNKVVAQNGNVFQELDSDQIKKLKEMVLWASILIGLLIFVGNLGYGGVVGGAISGFFFGVFGLLAYVIPIIIVITAFFVVANWGNSRAARRLGFALLITCCSCLTLELLAHEADFVKPTMAYLYGYENKIGGGFVGALLAGLLIRGFGLIGAYIIDIIALIISFVAFSGVSILQNKAYGKKARRRRHNDANEAREARLDRIQRDRDTQEAQMKRAAEGDIPRRQRKISGVAFDTSIAENVPAMDGSDDDLNELTAGMNDVEIADVNRVSLKSKGRKSRSVIKEAAVSDTSSISKAAEATTTNKTVSAPSDVATRRKVNIPANDAPVRTEAVNDDIVNTHEVKTRRPQKTAESQAEVAASTKAVDKEIASISKNQKGNYKKPSMALLHKSADNGSGMTAEKVNETADKLERTLKNFGINAVVENATCGPAVTRYEIKPEDGVRVNRITNLADDIKLNLAVSDIRIEAPIPGKAAVGIEVPNDKRAVVSFEEIINSKEFQNAESKVTFAVGKDIAGNIITANIAKMPHLLIAGTTGSGKSVLTNSIIMSILYKADPEEVKFIMVDPKVVEFSIYNGIPHLLLPVVTDPKKAAGALNWAVNEMDRRYQCFANAGARDIKSFNDKVARNGGKLDLPINNQGDTEEVGRMPEIVIIVDELADLMMAAAKEVEESICRLAQKARAAGMYMILATQRPSVDVVTGLIKANMPSRIALSVNSGIDSRTIIDMTGAENLLGNGDMLYYPQSLTKPIRVQGAFVRTEEIQNVVDEIKNTNNEIEYDENIIKAIEAGGASGTGATAIDGGAGGFDDDQDQYFAEAGRLIISKQKGSIGMLQRNFRIGFNRAARIMDQLEGAGVVGPELGTKPRTVLMTATEFEMYLNPNFVPDAGDDAVGIGSEAEYPISEDID
ncbi:MAG: DNA translocase FtsK [Lachnospiraceae bacterium]|nr:DNA translocase FtsK [Lachnospiraceae bacterium]